MKISQLVNECSMKILSGDNLSEKDATGCYCGDLLSWVMSKAQEGDIWLTVMGNVNSIGVAVLTEVSCIVLTDNASLDNDALIRAKENDVVILQTEMNTYETAVRIYEMLK